MAITVTELSVSRTRKRGRSPYVEVRYGIEGTNDDEAAIDALASAAPTSWDTFSRGDISVTQVDDESNWEGVVRYEHPELVVFPGQIRRSGSTTGGTQRIYQPLASITRLNADGTTAAIPQGILDSEDGVEGTDIVVPGGQHSFTTAMSTGSFDNAYIQLIESLGGTVNSAANGPFAIGEGLFLGMDYNDRGDGMTEVTYHFAASANRTGISLPGLTGTFDKVGWDFVWPKFKPKGSEAGHELAAVFVDRVYTFADHKSLIIDLG